MKEILATLSRAEIRGYEIAENKMACARQNMRLDTLPSWFTLFEAEGFFKKAIFLYADAKYLKEAFWKDLVKKYKVRDMNSLYIDFNTHELYLLNAGSG
jgi:hypothetical protein